MKVDELLTVDVLDGFDRVEIPVPVGRGNEKVTFAIRKTNSGPELEVLLAVEEMLRALVRVLYTVGVSNMVWVTVLRPV